MKSIIVIPCYNEEFRLDGTSFLNFVKQEPDVSFIFVNDGSSDNTRSIINQLQNDNPTKILAMHLDKNSGKGEAVRQGFLKAFSMNADIIGFLDADLATPLNALPNLISQLTASRAEIVMGSRVALLGRNIQRLPIRHYAGRLFATLTSMVLHLRVYDTQCGAKLFRNTARLQQIFELPFTVKWIFDVEILARLIITEKNGALPVKDVTIEYPLQEWIDKKGSKLRLKDFLTSGLDLFKIAILMQRKTLPPLN